MKWVTVLLGVLGISYFAFFSYNSVHEAAIVYNARSGEVTLFSPGPHISPPWVFSSNTDIRPQRVCITSVAKSTNCKLVQFIPSEYQKLIEREGFRYYWWDNRISFNLGYREEYRGFIDILRGYTFTAEKILPPFIKILEQ